MSASTKPKKRREVKESINYSPQEARKRFERAVDIAVATKPMHKPTKRKRRG